MDEDYNSSVLVIDLDDEREEKEEEINKDDEKRPMYSNNVNDYIPPKDKSAEQMSDLINPLASPNINRDYNSDHEIQVIGDDDEYENSVRNLVIVANKVKNYRMQQNGNQDYKNYLMNNSNRNRLEDPRTCYIEHNQVDMGISRGCVKENQLAEMLGNERNVYRAGNVLDVPYFGDNHNYRQNIEDAYRQEIPQAHRQIDRHKPEAINIDEYNAAINRYAHNHIEIPDEDLGHCYRNAARQYECNYRKEELLNINDYRQALDLHDYGINAIYRNINKHVYIPAELTHNDYNYASINRGLYHHVSPELALSNNYYRHTNMREAYNIHPPVQRLVNDDIRYKLATTNRFPHTLAPVVDEAIDDYWQTTHRHTYRPEVRRIEDYRYDEINRHYWNGYKPLAVNMDFRPELDIHRPDLVTTSSLQPMFTRNMYPEEVGMYQIPQARHVSACRRYEDVRTKDEAILNLSRKHESANVTNSSRHEMDDSKLRTILSMGLTSKAENPNIYVNKQKQIETYRTTADNIRSSDIIPSTIKPEAMYIRKPGFPATVNRPSATLSTKNDCQKGTSDTPVYTDVSAVTNIKHSYYDHDTQIASTNIENSKGFVNVKGHVMHEDNEQQKGMVIERDIDKIELDNKIHFLVVFFTHVKESVKETFPEFSKSIEWEIDNLGKVASNGKVKMDIQFICPLHCSVSTYFLPLFDNTEADNKIENHINRTKNCDVCSCIQNCYKLYKKRYLNLLPQKKGRKKKIMTPLAGTSRDEQQTVGYRQKTVKFEGNRCANEYGVTKESNRITSFNAEDNIPTASHEHKNSVQFANQINKNTWLRVNEKTKDSLTIIKLDVPGNLDTEKRFQNVTSNENENKEINHDSKKTIDNSQRERQQSDVFTCYICSCIFTNITSLVSHLQKEHSLNDIDEDMPEECTRQCPFCGIYSKQKYHNDHVKKAHPQMFTHKGEIEIELKVDKRRRNKKRKFIFTCLVCFKNLQSREVKRHREKEHKGVNIPKMFTKKLSTLE